ncbi:hypothetical protein ABEB36_009322 [Hypothenemus hampei]|uniref:Uncharacterized protein n=1 Tax=Hypothenemus hampei TaxID=57062 RepID=A0ABD1EK55_HYPHA
MENIASVYKSSDVETLTSTSIKLPECSVHFAIIPLSKDTNSDKKRGRKKRDPDEQESRKRIRNEKKWSRNIPKENKAKGEEYVSAKGLVIKAKVMKAACASRRKCYGKISLKKRQLLHQEFYGLTSDGQQQFIANTVLETQKARERRRSEKTESHRQFSRNLKKVRVTILPSVFHLN